MSEKIKKLIQEHLIRQLFQPISALYELMDDPYVVLDAFLKWVEDHHLLVDWRMPLYWLIWLKQISPWQDQIDEPIVMALLMAALKRWSLRGLEHLSARGILLTSSYLPHVGIGLWKSNTPGQGHKMVRVQFPLDFSIPVDSYVISHTSGQWPMDRWVKWSLCF